MHLRILYLVQAIALSALGAGCATAGRESFDVMLHAYERNDGRAHDARARDETAFRAAELDRHALIRAVLDRNPSIEAARQAWRAALARYRMAGAYDDPMLMGSFAPLSLGASHARFGFEVELSQRIPLGGKLDAQSELAVAGARAAESDYAETTVRLALVASELYDDYFVAVRSLEIQAQHLSLVDALKRNASAAFASGHASTQDALQAEAELARLEYQRSVYETQRQVAVAQLNALLHRDPDASLPPPPLVLPTAALPLPTHDGASLPTDVLEKLLAQRPDVAAAQARLRVARAQRSLAESEYYPDLTLAMSYNSMWDMPQHRVMAGVSLNLPLQRERRHAAIDEAAAMRSRAESDVADMSDTARGELAVVARRIAEAERAVALFEQRLVPIAHQRIEAAQAGFITQQTSFSAVIEAERGLRSAELELQLARADLSKRRAELDRVLGRVPGFEEVKP